MKKKVIYCQFSDNFLFNYEKDNIDNKYYEEIFKIDGYYKTKDFWEIPLWIAEADFFLSKKFNTKLKIINKTIADFIKEIYIINPDYLLFSVLDINKKYVKQIIQILGNDFRIILGGYIDKYYFVNECFINIVWLDKISELENILDVKYEYGNNYNLFKDIYIIPRLRLSSGCKYKCKFCTIDKNIKEVDKNHIDQVVQSFKVLNFKYIYIDDKTFGQASNFSYLEQIYKEVKKYNKIFKGFIIQTTANMIETNKINYSKLKIKIVEFGLESYNDNILNSLRKPISTSSIKKTFEILKNNNIKIIPNIIIGIKGETLDTYNKTLNFIRKNIKNILFFNIYSLSVYKNTELENELEGNYVEEDSHENKLNKSFHNKNEIKNNLYVKNEIYKLFFKEKNNYIEF